MTDVFVGIKRDFETNVQLLTSIFGKLKDRFVRIGKDTVDGLIMGMQENWQSVVDWLEDQIGSLVDAIRNLLGIQSPSKVFAGIGANVSRGLAVGIQSGFGEVAGSMASVTAGMVGGVAAGESYAMSNYGNINVIMPQERSSGAQLLRDLSLAMAV